jgi:hypothetical protein
VDWLPVAARNNWVIITRDRRITDHRQEIAAVRTRTTFKAVPLDDNRS